MHDHERTKMLVNGSSSESTCADELEQLLSLARDAIVALTGSQFPYLEPTDAAHALMVAAILMPEHLRLRTMSLGVSLLHVADWEGGLGVAARHGDPLARVIHDSGFPRPARYTRSSGP